MKNEICSVALVALFLLATPVPAQKVTGFADIELYESVVDHLFRPEEYREGTGILLRYLPTDSGEMQVQVRECDQGSVEVDTWTLPSGSPNIWDQLSELTEEHPTWGIEDLATVIEVDHTSWLVDRSSELSRLIMDKRPSHVSLMGSDTLTIHGTAYQLTLTSFSKNVSVKLRGPQNASISKDPLIRWMGRVRTAVESRLARKVGAASPHQ